MADKSLEYLPSLGRLLGFAERGCSELSDRNLAREGLTRPQWVLLTALWRRDGLTVGELGEYYRHGSTVMTKILDRMVEKGLVERGPDPDDRRVVRIFLTEKTKKLSHLLDFFRDINDVLLRGFTEKEKDALFALLERVIANSREALEGESGQAANAAAEKINFRKE